MSTPWSRVVNTTIKKYIKEREDNVFRNRKLLALLKSKGRVTFNWSGIAMDWKVRYKRAKMHGFALDGDTQEFSRKDRFKTATLDWRGYAAQDSQTKGERLQNRNTEAIINYFSEATKLLMDDVEDQFGEEFYKDGTLPANLKGIHGIETFMGGALNSGDGYFIPSGSFAGLSCVPGYYGGTWSPPSGLTWPNGRGDTEYDFWAPIIVAYDDTYFGASSPGWNVNAVEAVRALLIKCQKSKSAKGGQIDVVMTDDEMYRLLLNQLDEKERIIVGNNSQLVKLGFKDVVNIDGTDVTWEYGIPGDVGYGFNCSEMELRSMQAQVFVPEGPDYDISSKSWRYSVDFFGNCVWNPKYFGKLRKSA